MTVLLRLLLALLAVPLVGAATAVAHHYGGPMASLAACVSAIVGMAVAAALLVGARR
ncbi:hypothetical protein ACU61A_15775 [Pseudonocardia sichuanensis]